LDLAAEVERLKGSRPTVSQRHLHGIGGDQVLIEDPPGNPVELLVARR
jgi:hypothetical protein